VLKCRAPASKAPVPKKKKKKKKKSAREKKKFQEEGKL
jgi:hypothetical protein